MKYCFIYHNNFAIILLTLYTLLQPNGRYSSANVRQKKDKFKNSKLIHCTSHLIQLVLYNLYTTN